MAQRGDPAPGLNGVLDPRGELAEECRGVVDIGDGVGDAGVVDAVECLEALVGVGGERVGAVGGCVLDADFGSA